MTVFSTKTSQWGEEQNLVITITIDDDDDDDDDEVDDDYDDEDQQLTVKRRKYDYHKDWQVLVFHLNNVKNLRDEVRQL